MATISENLEALKSVKADIKSAIEGKGQDLTNVPFTEYSNKINEITTKEDLDAELNEQEELLNELESLVNTLPDKNVDLSQTTATAEDVLVGKKIYNVDGELVEGTYKDMLQQRVDNLGTCYQLFYQGVDTNIDYLNKLDTSNITDMSRMFYGCENLTSLDLSNLDTSNVTTMNSMFYNCKNLPSIDVSNFDTSNVIDMFNMFSQCKNLPSIDVSNFDTRNVTSIGQMFTQCIKLTSLDLSNFNTSNVTNMKHMFNNCENLTSIDLSSFDTSNVTAMSGMFYNCKNLPSIDVSNFDTSNVTTMESMFSNCQNLTSIDLSSFDTSNVTAMGGMFYNCRKLNIILGELNLIKCTSTLYPVSQCTQLKTVTLKNIKVNLTIGSSKQNVISGNDYGKYLTNETLINTIQELWDNTDNALGGSRTLQIGYVNTQKTDVIYVKLIEVTDEMIANDPYIENKKPCVVCEPTDEGAMTLTEYAISKNWSIA